MTPRLGVNRYACASENVAVAISATSHAATLCFVITRLGPQAFVDINKFGVHLNGDDQIEAASVGGLDTIQAGDRCLNAINPADERSTVALVLRHLVLFDRLLDSVLLVRSVDNPDESGGRPADVIDRPGMRLLLSVASASPGEL
jgi:hypothetical protein